MDDIIRNITIYAIPLIFAITVHEAAHAYAAKYFGDATAYMMGRMTLNPVKHIDPIWTIVMPVAILILSAFTFVFGGAKPVPINQNALRNPKRDMIWVAAAGPAANLIMMLGWFVVGKFAITLEPSTAIIFIISVAKAGIFVNALLMIFNLFPILPLDGGRIVAGLLPQKLAYQFSKLEPYGLIILVALILSGATSYLLLPALRAVYAILGLN